MYFNFVNSAASYIDVSYAGANTFADNVSISNTSSGYMRFGAFSGTSVLAATKYISTPSYTSGSQLSLDYVTSPGTTAFGTVDITTTFSAISTTLNGDIDVNVSGANGTITLNTSSFTAGVELTGDNVQLTNANALSTTSGATIIIRTDGGGDCDWTGGNSFGTFTVVNQDAGNRIRMANTNGDTFYGPTSFQQASGGT